MGSSRKCALDIILSNLMQECDVDDVKLSRETSIPASTISRIRLNPNANPTAATLRPIARFFGISISQLLGDEPLPKDRLPGLHFSMDFTSFRMPIIEWNWIIDWIENNHALFKHKLFNWISSEKKMGYKSFAVSINTDSFGLAFRKGSVIIVDPDSLPQDGDLVLLKTGEDGEICLKKFLKDGRDIYIRSVNPGIKNIKPLTSVDKIMGVVIETRFYLQEKNNPDNHSTHFDLALINGSEFPKTT